MKIISPILLTSLVLLSSFALAQDRPIERKDTPHMPAKVLIVFGKVSADARTLLTDLDSEWKITNTSVLQGFEDRLVRVRCYVDTERNQLQILSIKRDDGQSVYAVRYGDSAFRR